MPICANYGNSGDYHPIPTLSINVNEPHLGMEQFEITSISTGKPPAQDDYPMACNGFLGKNSVLNPGEQKNT